MSVDAADTDDAARRLVRRLKWTRFVVRLVGGLSFLMGAALLAVSVYIAPERLLVVWAPIMAAFGLTAIVGLGLLEPMGVARRVGSASFLSFAVLWTAYALAELLRLHAHHLFPGAFRFVMTCVYVGALYLAFGAALLPVRAVFVCRYLGARRIAAATIVEALRWAVGDRSRAVRRFATTELLRLGLAADEGEGHQALSAEG